MACGLFSPPIWAWVGFVAYFFPLGGCGRGHRERLSYPLPNVPVAACVWCLLVYSVVYRGLGATGVLLRVRAVLGQMAGVREVSG